MDSHQEYLELCAASTAGELSADEERKLEEHLAECASCLRARHEFESAVQRAVPALADDLSSPAEGSGPAWSVEQAEAALFRRLESEQHTLPSGQGAIEEPESEPAGRRFTYRPSQIRWGELWMPFAACVLLAIALGIVAYRSGLKHSAVTSQQQTIPTAPSTALLEEQISDFGHERAQLLTKLADDDSAIKALREELAAQTEEIKHLKPSGDSGAVRTQSVGQSATSESAGNSRRDAELAAAQANLQQLQAKADALSQERENAAKRSLVLEAKVEELTELARKREQAMDEQQAQISKQQELLDHDRDIRELMGARDLYIAEVHDVGGNGQTDKTYGRVFYTKGKSLIFYAYDLDQEAGLKNTSTFQAWGRRGSDKQQALSLGVFYEDNTNKKRWILKFDDSKALASIDAVFVTVEPNGGSHHPSGKELLFAYLRVNPNHP
jgi:Anti-sigma-K factor rskA/Putative zinc-finger